jgi:hypothetical protein
VKRAVKEDRSIIAVTADELGVSEEKAREVLDPERWTHPGLIDPGELGDSGEG